MLENVVVDDMVGSDSFLLKVEEATRGVLKKKGVLKIFANSRGKHLWWSLLLIKVQALDTPILKNICHQLLL